MNRKHIVEKIVALFVVFFSGISLALLLPWLAGTQSLAAIPEVPTAGYRPPAVGYGAPAVGPCYATHNNGVTVFDSADANAVQQAVDAASPGDVVKVAGTCVGVQLRGGLTQTVYISKSLTLQGGYDPGDWDVNPSPAAMTTTLDADRQGRVAVISGTIMAALDGLYLTGGMADVAGFGQIGGGIFLSAELTVTNSIIYSNTASSSGGGLFSMLGNQVAFYNVTFSDNESGSGGAYFANSYGKLTLFNVALVENQAVSSGGAIFHNVYCTPTLTKVSFIRNSAGSAGGGLFDNAFVRSTMKNVAFIGNSAGTSGGALFNNVETDSTYTNVLFKGNSSLTSGGAVFNNSNTTFTLTNATISGNSSNLGGGGIYNNGDGMYIYNSIIWNNRANGVTGNITATILNNSSGGIFTATHSLVQAAGASGGGIWVLDPGYVDGGGNIDTAPKFVIQTDPSTAPTTSGDLHLMMNSPSIDTGNNNYITVPFDLDFLPRIRDGNGDTIKVVDMGVYEYPSNLPHSVYEPLVFK